MFPVAVTVGAVTDWRSLHSSVSERLLGLLDRNSDGYDRASIVHNAERLKSKVLLCHGMGDRAVPFKNAASLLDKILSTHTAPLRIQQFLLPNGASPEEESHGYNTVATERAVHDFLTTNLLYLSPVSW